MCLPNTTKILEDEVENLPTVWKPGFRLHRYPRQVKKISKIPQRYKNPVIWAANEEYKLLKAQSDWSSVSQTDSQTEEQTSLLTASQLISWPNSLSPTLADKQKGSQTYSQSGLPKSTNMIYEDDEPSWSTKIICHES